MSMRGVYVLITLWRWDDVNVEYATITVEMPDVGFEALMDSQYSAQQKKTLLDQLRRIAEAQNGNAMRNPSLVALYRISGPDGRKWIKREEEEESRVVSLAIQMQPICGFDKKGDPVPIKQSYHKVLGGGGVITTEQS